LLVQFFATKGHKEPREGQLRRLGLPASNTGF
jgi:hypothetical protein